MEESDIAAIRSKGWTQGSISSGDLLHAGGGPLRGEFIVVSHPCDVVQVDFEREPNCEVIPTTIEDVDGNLRYGKNPRRLQLQQDGRVYTLDIANRVAVPRPSLASIVPTGQLTPANARLMQSWLAARYSRPYFADEFNARLRPAQRQVSKLLGQRGAAISGVFLAVSRAELPEEESYPVAILIAMEREDYEDGLKAAEAQEATDRLAMLLDSCTGIEVVRAELLPESEITLDLMRTFSRWDYDYISFRGGADESLAPTI